MQRLVTPIKFSHQQGATLLVGLVILLLMTFIGLAAIRGSGMQELMAGNMRDRQLAFQAAEAGLRIAEENVNEEMEKPVTTLFDGSNTGHKEELDGSSNTGYWQTYDWKQTATADITLKGVKSKPVYVVERITEQVLATGASGGAIDFISRPDPEEYYRVTSRGVGGTDTAIVILQSNFKPF
ncbi:PilX N-terminal domain-containing pilus assembly protein [Microbulbifer variabilis]|uniref:pilus assembly PilX family protein n=1 Tax=Microbulbifer variabilis TaxID=266805 RepID=UPI001CFF3FDB|nr:PilX N-terminal domain-containing pilus assembly protein [Microbulbifer variabilis]